MVETSQSNGTAEKFTLWTPWGPQVTAPADKDLALLRRAVKKLTNKKASKAGKQNDIVAAKPECAYDL